MESNQPADDSNQGAPLEEVSLLQEKDLVEEPKQSPESTPDENGSPEGKLKSPKSVKWSEQLVSESSYTPTIDFNTSPNPSIPSNPSFKGLIIVIMN